MKGVRSMSNITWTDKRIESELIESMRMLGLTRMPTAAELRDLYGDNRLAGRVSRDGYECWAQRIGVPMADNQHGFAVGWEKYTIGILRGWYYQCEPTSIKHPYDLLINGSVKADVKASKMDETGRYNFHIAKNLPKADVYIMWCVADNEDVMDVYIIPAHILYGHPNIAIRPGKSKLDCYRNRWDIIDTLSETFQKMETTL